MREYPDPRLWTTVSERGPLQRGQHVAWRGDPHEPIGVVVRMEDGLVTVRADASGWELDVWEADDLVRVSEWRLIPRDGLSPAEREAIAACPWCDTLGMVDGDGGPEFCDHDRADVG